MGLNTVGGSEAATSSASESQKSKRDIHVSVFLSIFEQNTLISYNDGYCPDEVKNNGSCHFVHTRVKDEKGVAMSHKDQECIMVDCSSLDFNMETCGIENNSRVKKMLDRAATELYETLFAHVDGTGTKTAHINLCGYDLVSDLVYVLHYLCDGTCKNKVANSSLLRYATKRYEQAFDTLRNMGWTIKVDYCGVLEAYEVFAERIEREQVEKDGKTVTVKSRNKGPKMEIELLRNPATHVSITDIFLLFLLDRITSEKTHAALDVASTVVSPLSAVDAVIHVFEGVELMIEGKPGAGAHFRDAALDVVFIIPFAKIGKWGYKAYKMRKIKKAEEELAAAKRAAESSQVTQMGLRREVEVAREQAISAQSVAQREITANEKANYVVSQNANLKGSERMVSDTTAEQAIRQSRQEAADAATKRYMEAEEKRIANESVLESKLATQSRLETQVAQSRAEINAIQYGKPQIITNPIAKLRTVHNKHYEKLLRSDVKDLANWASVNHPKGAMLLKGAAYGDEAAGFLYSTYSFVKGVDTLTDASYHVAEAGDSVIEAIADTAISAKESVITFKDDTIGTLQELSGLDYWMRKMIPY